MYDKQHQYSKKGGINMFGTNLTICEERGALSEILKKFKGKNLKKK